MAPESPANGRYDAIVIGSGFGGCFAAAPLVEAGARVLMLERGGWVRRGPENWAASATMELSPYYDRESEYRVLEGGQGPSLGLTACVGGQSIFYGGTSLRMREADFRAKPEIDLEAPTAWPFGYQELEPCYERVEARLGVAGEAGEDPLEPPRRGPYPQPAQPLGDTARMVARAGTALGLKPFRLPLAIHYGNGGGRPACVACPSCDTFACAVGAKNDLASTVLPELLRSGLALATGTVAVRLVERGGRLAEVECVERESGRTVRYAAEHVLLAGGALASAHLLLSSQLPGHNPAGAAVGRYLVRHCNAIVFGFFSRLPDGGQRFHKQVAFHDFYFGHDGGEAPQGMLGTLQQLQTPPLELVRANAPRLLGPFLGPAVRRLTGLLAIAEDQPQRANGVSLDTTRRDRFGLPGLIVRHRYSERDRGAVQALRRQAQRIMRQAGALFTYTHHVKTFSHAAGTVRMGDDPAQAPLDRFCRFRGVDNLFVVDSGALPSTGAVNPSLTIAANALRVGEALARGTLPARA